MSAEIVPNPTSIAVGALHAHCGPTRREMFQSAAAALAGVSVIGHSTTTADAGADASPKARTMDSNVLIALQASRAWIDYSPAQPFDFVIGQHPVTEEQLHTELKFLYDRG